MTFLIIGLVLLLISVLILKSNPALGILFLTSAALCEGFFSIQLMIKAIHWLF